MGGRITDINNRGVVIGHWTNPQSGTTRAVRYTDDGGWEILSDQTNFATYATDINDHGDIIGHDYVSFNTNRGWFWRDGVRTPLPHFGGSTRPYYVSEQGVVTGHIEEADGTWRAFQWSPTAGLSLVPLLEGAQENRAYWVTDKGLIGGTQMVGHDVRPFFLDADTGSVLDLGITIGEGAEWAAPNAMNNTGEAVFSKFDTSAYEFTPYIYGADYGLVDLNASVEGDASLILDTPSHVNACGEITLSGRLSSAPASDVVAVLLKPVRTGDLDGDSDVDLGDYARLQTRFPMASGAQPEDGDLDADGDVDAQDAAALIAALRTPCR